MNGITLLALAAVVSVDFGWQPHEDGGYEYIIQIPPEMLATLRDGEDITSQLPPFLRDVRSYRITVGNSMPPRLGNPAEPLPLERSEADPQEPRPSAEVPPVEPTAPPDTAGPDTPSLSGPNLGAPGVAPEVPDSTTGVLADQGPPTSPALPEGVTPLPRTTFGDSAPEETSPPEMPLAESGASAGSEAETDQPQLTPEEIVAQQHVGYPGSEQSGDYSAPPWNAPDSGERSLAAAPEAAAPEETVTDVDTAASDPGGAADSDNSAEESPAGTVSFGKWSAALLVLFASLAANLYLGWITLGLRNKYRHAMRQLRRHRLGENPAAA